MLPLRKGGWCEPQVIYRRLRNFIAGIAVRVSAGLRDQFRLGDPSSQRTQAGQLLVDPCYRLHLCADHRRARSALANVCSLAAVIVGSLILTDHAWPVAVAAVIAALLARLSGRTEARPTRPSGSSFRASWDSASGSGQPRNTGRRMVKDGKLGRPCRGRCPAWKFHPVGSQPTYGPAPAPRRYSRVFQSGNSSRTCTGPSRTSPRIRK